MRAERERREAILRAEEKKVFHSSSEGIKQSSILQAEAKRQALIEEARGYKVLPLFLKRKVKHKLYWNYKKQKQKVLN